ncbi:hypothetical protein ACTXT7_000456 [Hymenolepis weldensis]
MVFAQRITEVALKSSRNLVFCLSYLDLLYFAIDYICTLKKIPCNLQLLSDIVSSKFEETVTLSRLALIKTTISKLRNAQNSIALYHAHYWKNFAIKQTMNLNKSAPNTPGPNMAEINEFCSIVIKALEMLESLPVIARLSDKGQIITRFILTAVLNIRNDMSREASNTARINSLQCLSAKLLVAIDQLDESELGQSGKQELLSRCVSVTDRLQLQSNMFITRNLSQLFKT